MKQPRTAIRLLARPTLAAAVLLMVPLVAMQFTDEVVWTLSDFVIMGVALVGTGALLELALMKRDDLLYRLAAGVGLAAAFLLFWVNAAVGIIGAATNDANFMYLGVLAVAGAGAFVARLRPRAMSRAMVATAVALVLVGALAVAAGLGAGAPAWELKVVFLTGFFAVPFLGSAWLFRLAARDRAPTGAEATTG